MLNNKCKVVYVKSIDYEHLMQIMSIYKQVKVTNI